MPTTPGERETDALLGAHETQHSTNVDGESPDFGHSAVNILGTISCVSLGHALAALDGTMVATLTSSISASYDAGMLLPWLGSGWYIALSVLQPLLGKLTDIYGRRAGLIACNIFFLLGNLVCAVGTSEWVIISGRMFAGLGGGGLIVIPLLITNDIVPLRRHGVWQGVNTVCFGLGAGLGGSFGGLMDKYLGWRWAFLALVPLTALSLLIVVFFLRLPDRNVHDTESSDVKWKRIDFLGSFSLTSSVALLLVALNSGGNIVPWSHPIILVMLPASGVSLLVFTLVELKYATEPVIPVRLLVHRTVLSVCLMNWFYTMSYNTLLFYAPIFFQIQGKSEFAAGIRLIPLSIGVAVGSVTCGLIIRASGKYYRLNIAVQCIFLITMGLLTRFTISTPNWPPFVLFFFAGSAYTSMLTIGMIAINAAVEPRFQAVVSSGSFAFRSTGSAIGITVNSLVFRNILAKGLWQHFGEEDNVEEIIRRVTNNVNELNSLPGQSMEIVKTVCMSSINGVFWMLFGLGSLGVVTSLMMREHTLHRNLERN